MACTTTQASTDTKSAASSACTTYAAAFPASSPLYAVETAFLTLACDDNAPLTFPASVLASAAPTTATTEIAIGQLRTTLVTDRTPRAVRDRIWSELIRRSREQAGAWTLITVAMAMPHLAALTSRYGRSFDASPEDLHAEILTALLDRIATVDITEPGIWPKLAWAARRAAIRTVAEQIDYIGYATTFCSTPPRMPYGHEDLVLRRAEREGVISAADADLIGMTRLEGVELAEAAELLGVTKNAVKIRRQRAEARLVAWITGRAVPSKSALAASRARG